MSNPPQDISIAPAQMIFDDIGKNEDKKFRSSETLNFIASKFRIVAEQH